eukprot:CAMPEP_0184029876 /NCGR_PEP_ID=MMETSP0955-20130417/947_1 /TAXON_ID=627963 /ORGANISM="Aplanochytrium sp, Strain PBS07" /LENGTH=330 /DNA_ID=CAMNT_0026315053 /DNA_START=106 /DNA_END=1098 /DNA_ORIENTATION=-
MLQDTDQCTGHVFMVRPRNFYLNKETKQDNKFQTSLNLTAEEIQERALLEFDAFVDKLRLAGIRVNVIQDSLDTDTPDSIFPNNWVSFHSDGAYVLYPMKCKTRQLERRADIITHLRLNGYQINENSLIDLSKYEKEQQFLEGTGSLVLDRINKIAYAALSERTDAALVETFVSVSGYRAVTFHAFSGGIDEGDVYPIYHTNVMMCIGDKFAVVCLESILNVQERGAVKATIESSGKEIVEISLDQLKQFAGNMLQLENVQNNSKVLVMSSSAFSSLDSLQKEKLLKWNQEILAAKIDTIETLGGGSARCCIAEIFCPFQASASRKTQTT